MDNWQLKILSGPHLGAEIFLDHDVYSIGSSHHCDIVLSDSQLLDETFKLHITEKNARLERINDDTELLINGKSPLFNSSNEILLASSSVSIISTGTLHIAIGDISHDCSQVSIPTPEENIPSTELITSNTDAANNETNSLNKNASLLDSGKSIAGGASLIVGLMAVTSLLLSSEKPSAAATPVSIHDKVASLNNVINTTQLNIVQYTPDTQTIEGYLKKQTDVKNLMANIEPDFPHTQFRVYATDEIIKGTHLILKSRGLDNINVAATAQPGTFVLSGNVSDKKLWKNSLQVIQRDIAGVKHWETDVTTLDNSAVGLDASSAMNIEIKSISVGDTAFISAIDGKKYFAGSVLDSGYTISKITANSIVMQRGEHQLQYHFGDK